MPQKKRSKRQDKSPKRKASKSRKNDPVMPQQKRSKRQDKSPKRKASKSKKDEPVMPQQKRSRRQERPPKIKTLKSMKGEPEILEQIQPKRQEKSPRRKASKSRKNQPEVPQQIQPKRQEKPPKIKTSKSKKNEPEKPPPRKAHPVPGKKYRLPQLPLNLNEVLRIGSVLERYGVEIQRRKAFEWLALNRADLQQDSYETAHKLLIALGDLPISKDLAYETVRVLVSKRTITEQEYAERFSIIERSLPDQHITVAQLSHLIAVGAAYYAKDLK